MLMDYYMARATLITALNELNYANAMLIADWIGIQGLTRSRYGWCPRRSGQSASPATTHLRRALSSLGWDVAGRAACRFHKVHCSGRRCFARHVFVLSLCLTATYKRCHDHNKRAILLMAYWHVFTERKALVELWKHCKNRSSLAMYQVVLFLLAMCGCPAMPVSIVGTRRTLSCRGASRWASNSKARTYALARK
jgi:hypothetical protein